MKSIASGALARIVGLVPAAIATLLASRFLLAEYDVRVFNGFILVISTMALIPLNGLGVGASVTATFASPGPQDPKSEETVLTATRVLALSTVGLIAVASCITAADLWPVLLGPAAVSGTAFGVAICVYALSFVPELGQSMLLGVDRNHVSILIQAFYAPATCLGVLTAIWLDLDGQWIVVIPAMMITAVYLVNATVAGRLTGFAWRRLLKKVPRRSRYPGARIRALAGPALIANITVPLTLHSDRLVLSHFGTERDLANYGVSWQIFAPILAVIGAAASPLWPLYSKARAEGTKPPSMARILALFCGLATVASGFLVLVSDVIARAISETQIDLGVALPVATGLVVVVQAAAYPLVMSLMDPVGVRIVAATCLIALPVNIAASIALTPRLGAVGPLLATGVVGLFVQTIPSLVFHHRRMRRPAPTPVSQDVADPSAPMA